MRGTPLIAAALVLAALSPLLGPGAAQSTQDLPTLLVKTGPAETGDYWMQVEVAGATLVDPQTFSGNTTGKAYLQYYLNDQPAPRDKTFTKSTTNKTSFFYGSLAPGDVVGVELLKADGTSYEPRLVINQTAAGPDLLIDSTPPNGGGSYWITVDTIGFDLVSFNNTTGTSLGEGHIHYYLNGDPAPSSANGTTYNTAYEAFQYSGLQSGDVVCAELANHDHSPLAPRAIDCQGIGAAAALTITSPLPPPPGSYDLTVETRNHDGQVRYSLNNETVATKAETTHAFSNLQAGDVILVELVDGSGNAISPPFMTSTTVQDENVTNLELPLRVGGELPPETGGTGGGDGGSDASGSAVPGFTTLVAVGGLAVMALVRRRRR